MEELSIKCSPNIYRYRKQHSLIGSTQDCLLLPGGKEVWEAHQPLSLPFLTGTSHSIDLLAISWVVEVKLN